MCLKHVNTRKRIYFVENVDRAIKLIIVLRFVGVEWKQIEWNLGFWNHIKTKNKKKLVKGFF